VVGNQCDYNGLYGATGAGIYVSGRGNRIEENQMTDNDFGMQILVGTNVVSGNCASGNTTDYSLTGTQLQGTAITATGTISTKDAWANFEF
jgi:parallel beta-helix repeat protein